MKFSKRMMIMLVATVMLVAGSLSYFAVASDVEPYAGVTTLCYVTGCGLSATESLVEIYYLWGSHRMGNNQECYFDSKNYVYELRCSNGHTRQIERQLTKNHSLCGRADQY